MNPRAVTTDVLLGLAPSRSYPAWAGNGFIWLRTGDAAAAARSGVRSLGPTTLKHHIPAGHRSDAVRLFAGFAIAVIVGVTIGLARRRASNQCRGPTDRTGLWRRAEVRFIGAVVAAWFRPTESKITLVAADACFRFCFDLLRRIDRGTETDLVGDGRGHAAPGTPVQGGAAAAAPSILTDVASASFISCIVVFLAEMITSTDGLGHVLVMARGRFRRSTCSCR